MPSTAKKRAVQWSLPLHRERNNQKTAPTQLPFNRKHRGFWPPWLLWRPSPSHFSTFLVILSLSHKTGNQQTSSPRKLLASHLLIWNFSRSSKQVVSKYTKTWAFKTAKPLTFGVFWFSVNKQPNDSNPSGPAGLGSCWDQICRPLSPFCHYPKRCWASPISHGGELENLYNSNT